MARAKVAEEERAFNKNVSFKPEDYERIVRYCQRHPYQPSISQVIRVAVNKFLDEEEKKL